MEIILPAAGLSTRFPNMRPKFTLTDYKGMMMFDRDTILHWQIQCDNRNIKRTRHKI